ncbi:MAG: glycosyltransferase [Desulfobacteraceae bacterium]|nr:glycosyltransferase [Desulfobacteraceae bacterium]
MAGGSPKIVVAAFGHLEPAGAGAGLFGYHLCAKLHRESLLHDAFAFSRERHLAPEWPCRTIPRNFQRVLWRLYGMSGMPAHVFRGIRERIFDLFCMARLRRDADILVTFHPVIPRTLKRAKELGIATVLIPLNPCDFEIADRVRAELAKWNVRSDTDAYTSEFRLSTMRRSFASLDCMIATTSLIRETFERKSVSDARIMDAGFPLCYDFTPAAVHAGNPDGVFRVGYIGHTVWLKGLQYLMDAWSGLNLPGSELVVAGKIAGGVSEFIRERHPNLRNVRFLGDITAVADFMRSCSVLVCPSIIDGVPLVAFEAMLSRVPVVVTEGCGAKDLIGDGVEGFVIPVGDSEAIARKIRWFHENPESRAGMGENAFLKMRQFRMDGLTDRLKTALEGIFAKK